MKKKIYQINALKGKSAEILIYENIGESWYGGLSAKRFADDVKALGKLDELTVRINSDGGNVFDGIAIYNTLVKTGAKIIVEIDGIAASIASIIAMAGDEIRIADNAYIMIHDPWVFIGGTAAELRDTANTMDKVRETLLQTYLRQAGEDKRDQISDMMTSETWLTATEATDIGLATRITGKVDMAAFSGCDFKYYKNVPDSLKAMAEKDASVGVDLDKRARLAAMSQRARKLLHP